MYTANQKGRRKNEDENIIKVEFEGYGEKKFSRMFCTLVTK